MNKGNSIKNLKDLYKSIAEDWSKIIGRESPIDYDDISDFIHAYTQGIDETYPLSNESSVQFEPYIQILHFSVAYNHFLYEKMTKVLTGKSIYMHLKTEPNPLTDLLILQIWRQKNFALDNIVRSFCIGREFQAFQQLRSYIESCQLIFLLLTDVDSINRYLNQELSSEDYNKLWWKHLSPSKIVKQIKSNKQKVLDEEKNSGMKWRDIRKCEPGNYEFLEKMLSKCNDYLHWNKDALIQHTYNENKSAFRILGTRDWSSNSKQNLVNLIETASYTTSWLKEALSIHITLFDTSDLTGQTLEFYHSVLALTATYNGMYEFAENA